ncbi:MAG: histidine kinase [Marmoricola sp.]
MDPAVVLARVPPRPTWPDAVLVLALLVWGVAEHVLLNGSDGLASMSLFVLAVTVPLAWRRQQPLLVLAVLTVAILLRGMSAPAGEYGAAPFPELLVLTFSLALHVRPVAQSALAAVVPAALMIYLSAVDYYGEFTFFSVLILTFFVGGAWGLGRTVLRAAAQVEVEQARATEVARAAVDEERARIARELHDVVAHAVSIVVVQAGAAEALVDRDPVAAKLHLAAVRRTGREALAEMRHLLHVLREGEPSYVPQPGLSSLPDLVADVSRAGTPVDLRVDPAVGELPAGVELCAYRLVQEALTNVRKHAPGATTSVAIEPREAGVSVAVRNARAAGATSGLGRGGHGLAGMAERVRLYGGRLEAGPREDGFLVEAWLPLGAEA